MFLFGLIGSINTLKVEDNFHVCNTPNIMDLNNIFLTVPTQCTMSFKNYNPILHKNPEKKNAKLLIKTPYTLYGKSIQCQKLHVKITSYKNFFGAIWSNKEISSNDLNKNDCINMEKDLLCDSHVMSCEENICHYDGTPFPIYKYLQNIVTEGYICRKWYRNLESKDEIILEKCRINDLECQLKDSIVIWENNILNNCLFRVLENITITRPYNDIIYNEEKDQAFKIVSKEFNCKNEVFKTTSGLYITYEETKIKNYNNEIINTLELLMADSDGVELKIFSIIDIIKYELCILNNKFMAFHKKRNNNNFIIINNKTNPLIIFHSDGKYVLTKCTKLNEITLSPYNKSTLDPEISFVLKDTIYKGYLKENNIITKYSEYSIEKNWTRTVNFGKTIITITDKEIIQTHLNNSIDFFSFESYTDNLEFKHDSKIFELNMFEIIVDNFEMKIFQMDLISKVKEIMRMNLFL